MAGIDFLKTSTGKAPVGATLEAAATLLAVCAEADGRVGFKAAGGIRTAPTPPAICTRGRDPGPGWVSPGPSASAPPALLDDLLAAPAAATTSGY